MARTGWPSRFRAGVKGVRSAHAVAAWPNPWPGSDSTVTDSTAPLTLTTTRIETVTSSICSASASRGQGHDQFGFGSETPPERSEVPAPPTAPVSGPPPPVRPTPVPLGPDPVDPPADGWEEIANSVSPVRSTGRVDAGAGAFGCPLDCAASCWAGARARWCSDSLATACAWGSSASGAGGGSAGATAASNEISTGSWTVASPEREPNDRHARSPSPP
jgi:hypothetical protein